MQQYMSGAMSSSGDVYGYVHYGKSMSAHPQRSLDVQAPLRTCDILLDLERSALAASRPLTSDVGIKPDLMSRSCQFQSEPPFRGGNGSVAHATGKAEFEWKASAENPYSDLCGVVAAQVSTIRAVRHSVTIFVRCICYMLILFFCDRAYQL